jgi:hypothetical protein
VGGQGPGGIYYVSLDKQNRISEIDYHDGQKYIIQYDASGRVINEAWTFQLQDLPPGPPRIRQSTYNSAGQLIMQKSYTLNAPGDSSYVDVNTFQYPSTKTNNYSTSSWTMYRTDTVTTHSTYEYDDKVDPFQPNGYNLTSSFGATDNNVTQVVVSSSNEKVVASDTYRYTYTYTNAGYPLTRAYTSSASGSSMSTFSYTNCR